MTDSPLWRRLESGDGLFFKALRISVLAGSIFLLAVTGILYLTWPQQALFCLLTILICIWLDRSSSSYLVTLTLMLVSIFSTFRYGFWRISTTMKFFHDLGSGWSYLDAFFIWLLILAEAYAFLALFLDYLQTLWPLRRTPVSLPDNLEDWPSVDLLITTYDEPLSVVKFTALAAINIDWPADKLHVYLLDDGRRDDFRSFARQAGIGYITRDDNRNGRAGNINHALTKLSAPYVTLFDCDHVPTRSFLQVTMGWFLRDRKLGMLQTPNHFCSPDPFERNLDQFRVTPNEVELFHGIVQDGSDFWNATFFCGTCAVLRRSALDEIRGIAVETVTEDAHTSLRLQMKGWNTAYINIPQAAGLATEQLKRHVKQRIRWAQGMIQIMRTDNPLFAKGLNIAQRLCYFNAMAHFLYAFPRLVFLMAPLIYLLFGHVNIPGFWAAILAYAVPHLVLANIANSRIQGAPRHSFWNEIYETVLAPYIFLPTMLALISPRRRGLSAPPKVGVITDGFFDTRIAQPFLFMILINLIGILCSIPRFFQFPGSGTGWLSNILASMYDRGHAGTIVINLVWACFNTVMLAVATSVAWETQQRRQTVRRMINLPVIVYLPDGTALCGKTIDISTGGCMIRTERDGFANIGETVKLTLPVLNRRTELSATLLGFGGNLLRVQFDSLNLQEEEALAMILYSRADTWLGTGELRYPDGLLRSLGHIVQLAAHGFHQTARALFRRKGSASERRLAASIVPLLLFSVLLAATGSLAAQSVRSSQNIDSPGATSETFLRIAKTSDVSQSVSVPHHSGFKLQTIFARYPWLMVLATMAACFFIAVYLRTALRRHARSRLQGNEAVRNVPL
jgi:cellulose synthase (UDP-forming)